MSNTRKIKASRKNRIEKGVRDIFFGSNPHSNGEVFSRSRIERDDRIMAEIKVMEASNEARIKAKIMIFINRKI